jgi:hypothetical protein
MLFDFSPLVNNMLNPIKQPHLINDKTAVSKRYVTSMDPPLNSPTSLRSPLHEFQLAIATLNVPSVRELAGYLEVLDGKGRPSNNRFGTYGVWKLSHLPLNSHLWNEIKEPIYNELHNRIACWHQKWLGVHPEYRRMIKNMAIRTLDPKYKSLLDGVRGKDQLFDPAQLSEWLSKHRRNGTEPDSRAFSDFYMSVNELKKNAIGILEFLESQDNLKAVCNGKRFGMGGVQLLSRLTPAATQWKASGSGHLDDTWRQRLINAAKVLINPDYAIWTFQVHKGDMIFAPDDMQDWLDANRI